MLRFRDVFIVIPIFSSRFSYGGGDGKSSFLSQLSGVASSAASLIVGGGSPSHQVQKE